MWPRGRWEDIQRCLKHQQLFFFIRRKTGHCLSVYSVKLQPTQAQPTQGIISDGELKDFSAISEDEAFSKKSRCRDLFYGVKVSG